ncbi:MAG: hypothetical protein HY722_09605 [Planctomycetes bacterium]|nr:hypothetical protein [Planctomycetota bacterium]
MIAAYLIREVLTRAFFAALVAYALACLPVTPGIPLAMIVVVGYAMLRRMDRAELALSDERRTQEVEKERYFVVYVLGVLVAAGGAVTAVVQFRGDLSPAVFPEEIRHREQRDLLQAVVLRLEEVVRVEESGQEERGRERAAWERAQSVLEEKAGLEVQVVALEERVEDLTERLATVQQAMAEAREAAARERHGLETVVGVLEGRIHDLEVMTRGETR